MSTPLLSLKGINKSFGPVHVLKDVDFDVYPGQVTALVGDNGAGKSTLIKCIAGIYTPESGKFLFEGKNVTFIKCKRYINCIHFTHRLNILYYCTYKGEACYACPTNKERNSIQKAIFRQHIQATHPSVTTNDLPPSHTLIIEAHITSSNSKKIQQKVDKNLRNQIITTCGDADVMVGTKHIDPALCIYIGASLICIDYKHMKDNVPRGNGTLCRVLGVKLRENAPSNTVKNYYGKKYGQSTQNMFNGYNVNM